MLTLAMKPVLRSTSWQALLIVKLWTISINVGLACEFDLVEKEVERGKRGRKNIQVYALVKSHIITAGCGKDHAVIPINSRTASGG